MNLSMDPTLADGVTGPTQIVKRITEGWGKHSFYCFACSSNSLAPTTPGAKAIDFICPTCSALYQLKSSKSPIKSKINDGALNAMTEAINQGKTPNLLFLHYSPSWTVKNLLLIPSFFFTMSMIEPRKPLGPNARRAGWTGCYFRLDYVPEDGKQWIISNEVVTPQENVRAWYDKIRPLKDIPLKRRGWTLDVLNVVQAMPQPNFTLAQVYESEGLLAKLHPENQHVRDKIRQQLQELRDLGFIEFSGRGHYLRR